ncbi:MAG TPA: histidine kinase N-terminal 7TM domain-containing protein [Anaerolineales bacterium]|nr:histidine kinase N-terminal 7TM domain-containing protein [Anaerolineales bacterium]
MEISLPVYLICLGGMVVLTIGIALRAFANWRRPGARTFGSLMLAMAAWAGFYMLEIVHPELQVKIIARKFLYLGMTMSPPLWLGFALRYTGISQWWSKPSRFLLLIIPGLISFLLGITNESHLLIWETMQASRVNGWAPLLLQTGPGFWIHAVFAYLFIAAGIFVYGVAYFRSPAAFQRQAGLMMLGVIMPVASNVIFLAGVLEHDVDPTPLSFALSAPLLAAGYFHFGQLNLFPVAAASIIEEWGDAVIVVNQHDRITNLNRAAKDWLDTDDDVIGKVVFECLPEAQIFKERWDIPNATIKLELQKQDKRVWHEASVTHLRRRDQFLLGRVLVIRDVTQTQLNLHAEVRRSAQLGMLEEIGRQIADSFDKREILQRSIDAVVNRFGYAEAAISLLTEEDTLKVIAIGGTQDFGYRTGFKQRVGEGIIGHTAAIRKTYISDNVDRDPYYFSNEPHHGSAMCIPIMDEERLLGVLYVESATPADFEKEDAQTLETIANQISASLQRASLYSRTQEHLRIMSTVQVVSQVISASLDLETILNSVVKILKDTLGYSHIGIYLLEGDTLHLGTQVGYSNEKMVRRIHVNEGVSGRAIRTKSVQFIRDITRDAEFIRADDAVKSEICIPLIKENAALGVLNVEADASRPLTQEDADLLAILATPIALAVDNARLHAVVKKLATTDAVTGLANRHVFEQNLITEFERAQRSGANISLIIFDIDSFKEYNDTYGHPAGDARLKAVAEFTQQNLRKYDIAARYGGDEFAVILSNTNQQNALLFARRLSEIARSGAGQLPIDGLGIPGYSLSMGIATYPQDASTHDHLLIAADNAALRAKHLGKNRIQLAGDLANGLTN